jgi:hypothetical protein
MRFNGVSERTRAAVFRVAMATLALEATGCGNSGSAPQSSAGSGGAPVIVAPDGGFPAPALLAFTTAAGDLRIEVRTSPFQPPRETVIGEVELRITDATTGDPVDGLALHAMTYMPDMHHEGSALAPYVKPEGNGVYLVTRVMFIMAGKGVLDITVSGARTESVVTPTFDITKIPN